MSDKKLVYAAAMILSAALANPVSASVNINAKKVAQPGKLRAEQRAQILFFQHAKEGLIAPDQNKESPSCYRINLSGLKRHIIYFADQPARSTGMMNWSQFATTWRYNEVVEHIHPNAVIHAVEVDNKRTVNDTVILSDLLYDRKNNTVSYRACALDPLKSFAMGKVSDVSVFIDPFHPWP